MAVEVKITSKGQITIPKQFRDEFDLKEGKKALVSETASGIGIVIKPKSKDSLREWEDYAKKRKLPRIDVKKLMKETKREFSKFDELYR